MRILPNLPGYAALVAPWYAWRGRDDILLLQALFAALKTTLVFYEARRLFQSTIVGVFAAACSVAAVPAVFYVGQVFPSTIAASLTMIGIAAVSHWLPQARGPRPILADAVFAGILVALPWVHFKYALISLALFVLGLVALRVRLRVGADPQTVRIIRGGMLALSTAVVLCSSTVAAFCQHYFGTWTP